MGAVALVVGPAVRGGAVSQGVPRQQDRVGRLPEGVSQRVGDVPLGPQQLPRRSSTSPRSSSTRSCACISRQKTTTGQNTWQTPSATASPARSPIRRRASATSCTSRPGTRPSISTRPPSISSAPPRRLRLATGAGRDGAPRRERRPAFGEHGSDPVRRAAQHRR